MICGAGEAIKYIESVGEKYAEFFTRELEGLTGKRRNIVAGLLSFEHYEAPLANYMRNEFRKLPGAKVYGPADGEARTSTVVLTIESCHPTDVCKALNDNAIYAWDGDFYATRIVNEVLGLKDKGGLIRIGLAPYNTKEEIERTIAVISKLAR
jgi:selenocysteine lyase/cysteine desulfurase